MDRGRGPEMTETEGTTLRRNAMGVPEMVFLVIAFAAPLAASTTNIPMAIGLGNGIGAPGTWLVVGLLLVLFSVGYTAMSRYISNAGAFYAYITAGLGRGIGVGAGYVALIAYFSSVILIGAFFGFFASAALDAELGISVSWPVVLDDRAGRGVRPLLLRGAGERTTARRAARSRDAAAAGDHRRRRSSTSAPASIRCGRSRRRRSSAGRRGSRSRSSSRRSWASRRRRSSPRRRVTRSAPSRVRRTSRSGSSRCCTSLRAGPRWQPWARAMRSRSRRATRGR